MDLRESVALFVTKFPQFVRKFDAFTGAQTAFSSDELSLLISALSELVVDKVAPIVDHFGPLLLSILHKSAIDVRCGVRLSLERHEDLGVCLSKLCPSHSFVLRFALEYFQTHPPVFDRFNKLKNSSDKPRNKKFKVSFSGKSTDIAVVRAAHDFLLFTPNEFSDLWDWTSIVNLLRSTDDHTRWFACLCCCALFNLSADQVASFLTLHFNVDKIRELAIRYDNQDFYKHSYDSLSLSLTNEEFNLSDNVANVGGVLLSCKNQKRVKPPMVIVPSTSRSLYSLALAVKRGLPVLIQGPIGCGKTAIVEHIATVTGRSTQPHLLKVQLGDQTDSKMLIGTYQCTEVPGEFVWQPGTLLTAVEKGYWILLEDIDYAPMDLISMLIPLLETGSLNVSGQGRTIKANPGFQLFVTRRLLGGSTGFHTTRTHNNSILDKLFTKISMEPLSISELALLIRTEWPILEPVIDRLLEIYSLSSSTAHLLSENSHIIDSVITTDSRPVSNRDLLKWCKRVAKNFSSSFETSAVLTFQDALDCFCGSISKIDSKIVVAEAIAARLNITKEKVEYFCNKYKPNIKCLTRSFIVGRATLPRKLADSIIVRRSRSTFAFTRQASILLEQIAVAIYNQEPVLLVGETGTGKTATVQYLAEETGHKLVVINMNQQSDSSDLLGGFKPVDLKLIVRPVKDEYEQIFCQTFSRTQNSTFLSHIANCFVRRQWAELFQLMLHTQAPAIKRLTNTKELKPSDESLIQRWQKMGEKIENLQAQVKHSESALAFTFIEGSLVRALREGDWILLDEVNLASAETLDCLGGLLESPRGSVLLLERGDIKTVERHANFRLFACMNPATDVGKRELPPGLRNRLTEIYMEDLDDGADLSIVVRHYLKNLSVTAEQIEGIVKFYLQVKGESSKTLTDGTGRKPHYSLRTLCRALSYAAENPCQGTSRSLYEAFCMSFLTQLDRSSHPLVKDLIVKHLLAKQNVKSTLMRPLPEPPGGKHVKFEGFWIQMGTKEPRANDSYILTASVRRNLLDLARVVAAGRHPVLLQGNTSVGKTSLVKWLADASGHNCVRVNNHEHTDLQEYVGSYAADDTGRLVFTEGVLVNAMRNGDWIILDELNLAPTDVLEALNRVLDDNRELFITETQETVKAHPGFCLFATQNPPGHYGGRKLLSRAFRNRFVELHFEEIPSKELETILNLRCALPPSYCSKLVATMTELQMRRSGSGIFSGKQGFITLRDLFRWAERYRLASKQITKFYDWDQHLADEGYLLLAGRVRNPAEEDIILNVLKKHFKRDVDPQRLFAIDLKNASPTTSEVISKMICAYKIPEEFRHLVWTFSMRRLAVLLGQAMRFDEPVLMVGETGCGKTTLCQLVASLTDRQLRAVNCHMHSEGADFLGGLRPVRNHRSEKDADDFDRLFEWVDGPLVMAMKEGSIFLADEISLADDSVLERLNSVLEPERTLLLAEKGGDGNGSVGDANELTVIAESSFRFLATMNPGGDFGKKELSPALRNRFTEIWCPNRNSRDDLLAIIEHNIAPGIGLCNTEDGTSGIGHAMLDFLEWFDKSSFGKLTTLSVRDILAWVHFINVCCTSGSHPIDVGAAYVHGANLVVVDSIGSGVTNNVSSNNIKKCRNACLQYLVKQLEALTFRSYEGLMTYVDDKEASHNLRFEIFNDARQFGLKPFYIDIGESMCQNLDGLFAMTASSTAENGFRILRAMQLSKPILLEGSPGVGKTSLIVALAKASGHNFIRINLSEQTDISDLFGADLPVEGGRGGQFAWRDGPFLRALKLGHWIVLDELNLASQSVLEGLNACLDHRAEIYIPELGRTFGLQPGVKRRIFACQNPLYQGGARKGLPRSFLNRFTRVYVEPLTSCDLELIASVMFPKIPPDIIAIMVRFNQQIYLETAAKGSWGTVGGPWEVNLRDIFRWCELMTASQENRSDWNPSEFVGLIYADRMRTKEDKQKVFELCAELIPNSDANSFCQTLSVTKSWIQLGYSILPRTANSMNSIRSDGMLRSKLTMLPTQFGAMRSLMKCIEMNWMAILVGPHASGKTSLVNTLGEITGSNLQILNMNSDMDTTELLGGFEQVNLKRHLEVISEDVRRLVQRRIQCLLSTGTDVTDVTKLTLLLEEYKKLTITGAAKTKEEAKQFLVKVKKLNQILDVINLITNSVEISEMLFSLRNKLKALEKVVQVEESPNGRFEWIDSLLVKALQNGSWLLIDNVNFCSPSVLDRLNALLEPGGVLTISERGVVDGEIPTVVPHPNFRLILSMDPKNGEISRAMRNRGVEIFLHEGNENFHFTDDELRTILHNMGLSDLRTQQCLIHVHREIGEQLLGTDSLSFSDFLQASHLTVQNLQEGCNIVESLNRSCSDVYVRCRYLTTKKALAKSLLEEILGSAKFEGNYRWFACQHHLLVSDLRMLPELATAKQEMVVLTSIIQLVMTLNGSQDSSVKFIYQKMFYEDFKDFEEVRLKSVFSTAITMYLMKSSPHDYKLRLCFLKDFLQSSKTGTAVNSKLKNILENFKVLAIKITDQVSPIFADFNKSLSNETDVAYDPRWNSDLSRLLLGRNKEVVLNSASANRFILLLKDAILKGKRSQLSSFAALNEFTDFPNDHLVRLFELIFSAVDEHLHDSKLPISDELSTEYENAIHLLYRAHAYCAMLFKKKRLTKGDIVQLRLYLNDIFAKLFPIIFGSNWETDKLSQPQLTMVYGKISSFLRKSSPDNVNVNAIKLSPLLGSAKPFNEELQAEIHCRLERLWNPDFVRSFPGNPASVVTLNERLLNFYVSSEGFIFRQRLCNLLLKNIYVEEDKVLLKSLENELKSVTSSFKPYIENMLTTNQISSKPDVFLRNELLPIVEHLAILQQQHNLCLMTDVLKKESDVSSAMMTLSCTIDLLGMTITATPLHLAVLETSRRNMNLSEEFCSSDITEIQRQFYEFCRRSAHVAQSFHDAGNTPYSNLLLKSTKSFDYICHPQLSTLIAKFFSCRANYHQDECTTNFELGFCEEKSKQLHRLNCILWTNAAAIASKEYDPQLNDTVLFWSHFYGLAKAICTACESLDLLLELTTIQSSANDYLALEIVIKKVAQSCSMLTGNLQNAWLAIDFSKNPHLSWIRVGWLRVALLAPIFDVDPAEEQKFRISCYQEKISRLEEEIHVVKSQMFLTMGGTLSMCNPSSFHPCITHAIRRVKELKSLVRQLEDDLPFRPSPSQYEALRKDFLNYWTTVASKTLDLFEEWTSGSPARHAETLSKIRGWLCSQTAFVDRISANYPLYRDLTHSCCLGVLLMMHGAVQLINKLEIIEISDTAGMEVSSFKFFISDKLLFPYRRLVQLDYSSNRLPISVLISKKMLDGIQSGMITEDGRSIKQIFKSAILELRNQAIVCKTNEFGSSVFQNSVDLFANVWHAQEERRRENEANNERTFELRPREHGEIIDDEKQLDELVKKTFPSYKEVFEDLVPSDNFDDSVNQMDVSETPANGYNLSEELSECDIHAIVTLYKEILVDYGRSRWYKPNIASSQKQLDVITPILARHSTILQLNSNYGPLLENSFDSVAIGGHLIYVAHQQNLLRTDGRDGLKTTYDFYRDSNVTKVSPGQPILRQFSTRINELLAEWPDHPTLNQLLKIIDRILNFSITSPVMKFITGFELLLGQAQEWEKNAHKGVSISQHLKELTDQIIRWRKLEISCWSSCLKSIEENANASTSRWWLHLYKSLQLSSTEDTKNESDLKTILQTFMEKSSLGEYQGRLDLMFSMACFFAKETPFRNQVIELLWNLCEYYRQYVPVVEKLITKLKKPIEKKLKEFIKIARWSDINFWAVKQSVDKSHRTLLKHMHHYEVSLRQSMQAVFADDDLMSRSVTDSDSKRKNLPTKPRVISYFTNHTIKSSIISTDFTMNIELNSDDLSQLPKFKSKAFKLCRKLIRYGCFEKKIETLNEFVNDVLRSVHELQVLEVNKSASKAKQISEAKNIDLRKRKALADLFKKLSEIGLSYRKGLIGSSPDEQILTLTPIDIQASLAEITKNDFVDEFLLDSWQDCPRYLHRSLARMALMRSSLETPNKDLGPANIHRCQGFTTQLLHLSVDQRKLMAPLLNNLSDMRFVVDQFEVIGKEISTASNSVSQVKLREAIADIKLMVSEAYLCMKQFRVLLDACPIQAANDDEVLHTIIMRNGKSRMSISDCRRGDLWWTETVAITDKCRSLLEQLRHSIFHDNPSSCLQEGIHPWHNLSTVNRFILDFQTVLKQFPLQQDIDSEDLSTNPLTSSLFRCREEIATSLENILISLNPSIHREYYEINDVPGIARKLIKFVLKAIENLIKINKEGFLDDKENVLNDSGLLVNVLHGKLIQNIDLLRSKLIRDQIMKLYCAVDTSNEISENFKFALEAVNLVEYYLGLANFYLVSLVRTHRVTVKMSSVLLGIFIELVRKGFCVPVEYSGDVDGGQSTKFEDDVGGTGIGEGEGLKDVSDRIENEDQLEDAHQEGVEKENKDDEDPSQKPDLKDEENGIEMSDDFDGKVHDFEEEKSDDENESDDDEEKDESEELEKQMGDLEGDDGEKLDEKIWGDDDDEEDEDEEEDENDKSKKDEYGAGDGPQEESRIVAKDDNKEQDGTEPNKESDEKETPDDSDDKEGNVNMIDDREFDDKPNDTSERDDQRINEPDDMELPDDLDLDGKEQAGTDDENDENNTEEKTDDNLEDKAESSPEDENSSNETEPVDVENNQEKTDVPEGEENNGDVENNVGENEVTNEDIGLEPDEKKEDTSKAAPSHDKPTEEQTVQESELSSKESSADMVDATAETTHDDSNAIQEQAVINDNPAEDVAGIGLAEAETTQGHSSNKSSNIQQANSTSNQAPQRSKDKFGKSNEKRSIGTTDESIHKRLRTDDADDFSNEHQDDDEPSPTANKKLTSDIYKHISETQQHYDTQTFDAATESQASKQPVPNRIDEKGEELKEDDDLEMAEQDDLMDNNQKKVVEKRPLLSDGNYQKKDKDCIGNDTDNAMEEGDVVIDGEMVATSCAQRGPETTFHTRMEELASHEGNQGRDIEALRQELEEQLLVWRTSKNDGRQGADERISFREAHDAWRKYEEVVDQLSRDLCEQLRLILEPSLTAKLKGDYRTGKRLNMRKVIPYVASQFRKDKIWLRRTKPSKREYHILMAVDDSSSMADNHSKQLAFEALALICNALTLLEAGEIGVASFGETVSLLHPLGEQFSDRTGAELLRQFTFEQQKTRVGMMLDVAISTMLESRKRIRGSGSGKDVAQLLVIVSDGRGLFNEGVDTVKKAVRRARESNLFTVFVIVDNPANRDSILDIRVPVFKGAGQLPEIKSYMDDFPFPFYILLRDINGLPEILSDALRQWFELIASTER